MYRPGKHHKAVVGLDLSQMRFVEWMDGLSHWTIGHLTKSGLIMRFAGYAYSKDPLMPIDASASVQVSRVPA